MDKHIHKKATDLERGEVICEICGVVMEEGLENSDNVVMWRLGVKDVVD